MPAAREPLGDAEDAVRILDNTAEFPYARRDGAHRRGGAAERSALLTSSASCSNTPALKRSHSADMPGGGIWSSAATRTARIPAAARWPRLRRSPGARSCRARERCTGRAAPPAHRPAAAGRAPHTGSLASGRRRRGRGGRSRRHRRNRRGSTRASPNLRPCARRRASAAWSRDRAGCRSVRPRPGKTVSIVRRSLWSSSMRISAAPSKERHVSRPWAAWRPNCANLPDRERQAPMRRRRLMASSHLDLVPEPVPVGGGN